MASADFNNVTLRNVAPTNADGSLVHADYVLTVSSNAKQYWTNDLRLKHIVVSSILVNSTLALVAGDFITLGVSTATISTLSTTNLRTTSSIIASTINAGNVTYSTLTGLVGKTSLLTADTVNVSTLGFSSGMGLLLNMNNIVVNSSIVTSTLNGINLNYSTIQGSTLTTSTLFGSTIDFSTTTGSTLTTNLLHVTRANVNNGLYSTLTGSSITTSTLSISSLYYSTMVGSTIQTSTLTASTLGFSTMTGSTLNAAMTNVDSGFYSTLTGSSLVTSTLSVSSLYYSTSQGSTLITSSLTVSTLGFSTMTGSTLNVMLANVNSGIYSTLGGSTITTSTLFGSSIGFSTAQGSTMIAATAIVQSTLLGSTVNAINIGFSTLVGSTLTYNTAVSNSTLTGSTVNAVNIGFSTLVGSTIIYNTAVSNSTLTGSTVNAINIGFSTLQGSTITTNTMALSALTIGSTLNASSIQTTSLGYSTMSGSTITASTMNVIGLLGIGMTNPTYALQASTLNTVNLSGNYIQDWVTILTNSDSTAFIPTFNGTQTGPSGSPLAMNVLVTAGINNAVITFNNNVIPGNVYQFTITAKMSGTSPKFTLCDHIANDALIAGTAEQPLSGTYATYMITFTAPSGSFSLSCISQGGTTFSYYGVQLRAFDNQMIGGLGIGTTNPQYSLHVPKGSIQAYNFQQFEWINTQSNNRLGYNPATGAGLYKVATLGTTTTGYGMINVRGQIGGSTNTNTMYVDVAVMSRGGLTVWGSVYGNQSSAALQCDIVYCLNTSSQYDVYIYIKSATPIVYDLVVSGASGSNILYDPVAAAMIPIGVLTVVSISGLANIYSNSGNVGIGKTATTYKLDVDGVVNASQFLQNGAPISVSGGGGGGGGSQWITSGSNIYYAIGNVGIGTNVATSPLHIYGSGQSIRLDGSSAAQTYITFATQGTDRGYIGTGASGVDMVVAAYAGQNMSLVAGATERIRITSTGNVGIGTNPVYLFDIYGSNPTFRIRTSTTVYNSGTATILFDSITASNPIAKIVATDVSVSPSVFQGDLSFFTQYNTSLNEVMRITNAGYVGIGTNNPSGRLTSYTTNANQNAPPDVNPTNHQLIVTNNKSGISPYAMAIGMDQTHGIGYINAAGNGSYQPVCLQTRGGNVGVGTTNPGYPLHVTGNINLTGSILYNGVAITTGTGSIWTAGSGAVAYYNGGNVGIGKTNPTYALDVVGDVRVTGLITSGSTNIIPMGIIVMWSGSTSNVPAGWVLCNGTNGAPNLMDRFIVGAGSTYTTGGTGNGTGGSNTVTLSVGNLPSHTHTVPDHTHTVPNHTHSTPDHTHTIYDPGHVHSNGFSYSSAVAAAGGSYGVGNLINTGPSTTGISINNSGGGTSGGSGVLTSGGSGTLTSGGGSGTGAAITIIPLYYALCYIMKT